MEYREIVTAPENQKIRAIWGEKSEFPEYGTAMRTGSQWYIYRPRNPNNAHPCAVPEGWLPEDRKDWTKAERRLSDILSLHPELR